MKAKDDEKIQVNETPEEKERELAAHARRQQRLLHRQNQVNS